MPSKMSQLRAVDTEIVQHVIDRGKLWEKRKRIIQSLAGSDELGCYQAELKEWLEEVNSNDSNDQEGK